MTESRQPVEAYTELQKAHELDRYLHPAVTHGIGVSQPIECRNVVGPSRASRKVQEFLQVKEANARALRTTSQRTKERLTLASRTRSQLQRNQVEKRQRQLAAYAASKNTQKGDDVVEATLVAAKSVSLQQRSIVIDGLQKLLPPKKKRPAGVL